MADAIKLQGGTAAQWSGQSLTERSIGLLLDGSGIPTAFKVAPTGGATWASLTQYAFYTSTEATKLAGITSNAEPNPGEVTGGEISSGTETEIRSWSPVDVKSMVTTWGGTSVSSFNSRTGAITPTSGDYTADQITDTASKVLMTPAERTAISGLASTYAGLTHASRHKTGGADPIKLDELSAPTDVTTLNTTTNAHGLMPKLANDAYLFFNGLGGQTFPGVRIDTAANLAGVTLKAGQIGRESDTGNEKIGDGSTVYSSLGYWRWKQTGSAAIAYSTGSAQQIISTTIPLKTLAATGDRLIFDAKIRYLNNSGASRGVNIGMKLGSGPTTLFYAQGSNSAMTTSASGRNVRFVGSIVRMAGGKAWGTVEWTIHAADSTIGGDVGVGAMNSAAPYTSRLWQAPEAGVTIDFDAAQAMSFELTHTATDSGSTLGHTVMDWVVYKV